MTGEIFGRLTVLSLAESRGDWRRRWVCACACGGTAITTTAKLRSGHAQSCGCLKNDRIGALRRKHGGTGSPEFHTWAQIRQRCSNPNHPNFKRYGGRGIVVCERWSCEAGYQNFASDMGRKPSRYHSIERIDNDGSYSPANCIWATRRTQANNRRSSTRLTHRGETRTLAEWSRLTGTAVATLSLRHRSGWSDERAITTPVRKWGR